MVSASKLISIGIISLSLMIGLGTFYVISDLSKQKRREHIEEIVSQLINIILYIWMGKIILNFSLFIKDPLAILAYPSNSHAFYFAILLSTLVTLLKSKYPSNNKPYFIESLVFVLLVTAFTYEFIQMVWNSNAYAYETLIVVGFLLVLFISLREKIASSTLLIVTITAWSGGMVLLDFIQPIVTLFGYIITPWFVGLFYLISMFIIINKRRRERLGWN
ncbi:hypothetical protein [Guptibacillus sedimenti]|uniref:hypothetical protein n=1 Tax=Guptibacillus sedimenti TaxID=3025680 RepID=UPI00235F20F8|nr:hypothetical protein [Pseudalkalibacillus sedimenti]